MLITESSHHFDEYFKRIVKITCESWKYELPSDDFYKIAFARIPEGVREILSLGLERNIIEDTGLSKTGSSSFRPSSEKRKGPYSWFGRDNRKKELQLHCEYCVQAAEYVRLYEAFKNNDRMTLKFEDRRMDIGIYLNEKLLACCEIKEKSNEAESLIRSIKKYESVKEISNHDSEDFKKAKYIMDNRPDYFYLVSIGRRYEYKIEYPEDMNFKLVEDLIPLL